MTHALELCRAFLPPCEYLTCLWPCQSKYPRSWVFGTHMDSNIGTDVADEFVDQRTKYLALRQRYDNACLRAGVALSPPPNLNRSFKGATESLV